MAFVGLISNVSALCQQASWLAWLCTLPVRASPTLSPSLPLLLASHEPTLLPLAAINGIIQGSLPPIALAVLFILLPIVLRRASPFPAPSSVPRVSP